jgi:hypothetical protein
MFWQDSPLKPTHVAELKQFCLEEWARIPPQQLQRLINNYTKRLVAVISAEGGTTSY